jgi:hypothetical protein
MMNQKDLKHMKEEKLIILIDKMKLKKRKKSLYKEMRKVNSILITNNLLKKWMLVKILLIPATSKAEATFPRFKLAQKL